jgi:diguanylate cyclase (GGDEF)-like protein
VARYGGEEFAILMPDTTAEKAMEMAQRLCDIISNADIRINNHSLRTTISIGVACYDAGDLPELQGLLSQADQALYDAKHRGRNQACLYCPES